MFFGGKRAVFCRENADTKAYLFVGKEALGPVGTYSAALI